MSVCIIAGDFAPNSKNEEIIAHADPEIIVGEDLLHLFRNSDFVSINLETALTDSSNEKIKRGQHNKTKKEICNFLLRTNIKLCCLANNHVIDYGNEGVKDTIENLDQYSIAHIGASDDICEAKKAFEHDDVVIYNVSNEEFNAIGDANFGVNTLDLLTVFDDIKELKATGKYVIVIFHGGVEYYRYPSPFLQRICRKMIDSGADLVTCQHSHCVGTYELYNGKYVFYGQGNFLFDNSNDEMEKTGIVLKVDTEANEVGIVPICKNGSLVKMADSELGKKIIGDIEDRRKIIAKDGMVEQLFAEFAMSQEAEIMNSCVGYNKIYKGINKLTGGLARRNIFTSKAKMRLYNILKSIALREVMIEVMSNYDK